MPEWSHWLVDGAFGLFALYTGRRWSIEDEEKRLHKEENDRYNRRHEKTEDRVSIIEKAQVDVNRWMSTFESEMRRIGTEYMARLDRIEQGQRTIQSKLDRFSGRMESTRAGDE